MGRRPFLIDCDTGTDDAIAIMAALCTPQVEVKAITSVNGNVAEEFTSQNNLDLTEYLGVNLPVAHGASRPLLSGFVNRGLTDATHGSTGMGTVVLPRAARSTFDPRLAPQVIYETARDCGGELELLVIGPQTNLAIALCLYRDLPGLIRHLWFMGGAYRGGNVLPTAEFNVWCDPEAAKMVFASGIPMTMVGLDVTLKAVMTEEDAAALRSAPGNRAARLTADLLEFMFARRDRGQEDAVMHDALAFAAAVRPDLLVCRDFFADVVTETRSAYGHTYLEARAGFPHPAPRLSAAMEIDVKAFRKWLVETILHGV